MTTYFRLDLLNPHLPDACMLHTYPEGMEMKSYKICKGLEVLPGEYPGDARIFMPDSEPGMVVPDLVNNTCNILIVSRRLKEGFEAVNTGPVQYLPVAIFNHKKRPASVDHFIVNPLGTVDILDTKASQIEYFDGDVVSVETYIVDRQKALTAPDLFRVKENPEAYVISQKMLDHLRQTMSPKLTNVGLYRMEPAAS